MATKKREPRTVSKTNINKYIFASNSILQAIDNVKLRHQIICQSRRIDQIEHRALCNDFYNIAKTVIEESVEEYDYSYYLACIDALVEINYRMHRLEKQRSIGRNDRMRLRKLFKLTRDGISTFRGMRTIVVILVASVLLLVFFANITSLLFEAIGIKVVIYNATQDQHISDLLLGLTHLIICVACALMVLVSTTPLLKKALEKSRVYREEQRNVLYQILSIVFAVLFVVWAFFLK